MLLYSYKAAAAAERSRAASTCHLGNGEKGRETASLEDCEGRI